MSIDNRLAELKGHLDSIEDIVFSPDSKSIASVSKDCSVRIWDIEAIRLDPEEPDKGNGTENNDEENTENKESLLSNEGECTKKNKEKNKEAVAKNNNNKLNVNTKIPKTTVSAKDIPTVDKEKELKRIKEEHFEGKQTNTDFNEYENRTEDLEEDNGEEIEESVEEEENSGSKCHILGAHGHWILAVAYTKTGDRLITGSGDGVIKVWCLAKLVIQLTWRAHDNMIWHCATVRLTYGLETLLTASSDGTLRYLWFKYDLDRCTMHPKFEKTGVRTHDLQIMTVLGYVSCH